MFLDMLTPEQQGVFLSAARAMANADAHEDEREAELLNAFERETGLTPDTATMAAKDVPESIAAFDSRPRRIAALVELAGVALADGSVHEGERRLLLDVAEAVGLGREDVDSVLRDLELMQSAALRLQQLIATEE